jgi:hypothetical protein
MKPMTDKFTLDVELNITLAKRKIVDLIWRAARLEGIAMTYPQTEQIYNGMAVQGFSVDEIVTVNNLKHAWQFVFANLQHPTNFAFICEVNKIVGAGLIHCAGTIRKIPVSVGGTSWTPDMPLQSQISEQLTDAEAIKSTTDRAITRMLYLMRKQIFIDGNKRTAMLTANHTLIAHGAGILSIPVEKVETFSRLLIAYYETGDMSDVKQFIYDECITAS